MNKNMVIYGPYARQSDDRKIVIIVSNNGKRRTVSYPKYLIEKHLGKKLKKNETVDHWNSDKNDNRISNLKVVDRAEHSANDTRRVKNIKLQCALCDKEFERSPRLLRDKSKKGKAGPFCSRSCGGKYARMLQLKLIDKLNAQPYIESEYYKRKYVEASDNLSDCLDDLEAEIDIDFEELLIYACESDDNL
jgi:hypothetical protein